MSEFRTRVLGSATVGAMAQQLNEAIEEGRCQERKLGWKIQQEVDQLVHFGPGYLSALNARDPRRPRTWRNRQLSLRGDGTKLADVCPRRGSHALGAFLLDQVRLMPRRDDALRAGLYVAVTNHDISAAGRPVQHEAK